MNVMTFFSLTIIVSNTEQVSLVHMFPLTNLRGASLLLHVNFAHSIMISVFIIYRVGSDMGSP